jgi:hypothetical protein
MLAPASSSYNILPFDVEREVGNLLSKSWRLVRGVPEPLESTEGESLGSE